jgi:RecA-family ATPase
MGAPHKEGGIRPTGLWTALEARVIRYKPLLLVLDNLADVFGGNEINRGETRQFVGMLRSLAIKHNLAVLLLAHPSLACMANGSGISGSTAWNGSVRSRLYFQNVGGGDGADPDPELRILTTKKANYGPTGAEIRLRWVAGLLSSGHAGQWPRPDHSGRNGRSGVPRSPRRIRAAGPRRLAEA